MLHHLTLWVPDIGRAEGSWQWLLGELGYELDRSFDHVRLFRHPTGFAVVLEQSDDMVPGMLHCGGGPGPNDFDMLAALEKWVEQKEAPERVTASHATNGTVDRTRPLCVYPKVASYSGSGSTDDAANFVCKAP